MVHQRKTPYWTFFNFQTPSRSNSTRSNSLELWVVNFWQGFSEKENNEFVVEIIRKLMTLLHKLQRWKELNTLMINSHLVLNDCNSNQNFVGNFFHALMVLKSASVEILTIDRKLPIFGVVPCTNGYSESSKRKSNSTSKPTSWKN